MSGEKNNAADMGFQRFEANATIRRLMHHTAPIRAGDIVKYNPSGETYRVVAVSPDGQELIWCGSPDKITNVAYCTLVRAATDQEHDWVLVEAAMGRAHRIRGSMAGSIRAGDAVEHNPSGEKWLVAAVSPDGMSLLCSGWPETMADVSDCTLLKAASDKEHLEVLDEVIKGCGDQLRGSWARANLAAREQRCSVVPSKVAVELKTFPPS